MLLRLSALQAPVAHRLDDLASYRVDGDDHTGGPRLRIAGGIGTLSVGDEISINGLQFVTLRQLGLARRLLVIARTECGFGGVVVERRARVMVAGLVEPYCDAVGHRCSC